MKSILLSVLFLFLLNNSIKAQKYVVGDAVNIDWKGKLYPGKILEVKPGSYLVSYDGYGTEWNETVKPERLKPYTSNAQGPAPTTSVTATTASTNETSYKGVETIWDLSIDKSNAIVVCASAYGKILLLSAQDLSLQQEISTGKSPVMSVSISSDGKYIAAGAGDGKVYIYNTGRDQPWSLYTTIEGYSSIARLRFSPVKNDLYIAGAPKSDYTKTVVDVWSAEEKKVKQTLLKSSVGDHIISGISFTNDGAKVAFAVSNEKKGIEVYETSTGKLAYRINHKEDIVSCSFSSDGKLIAGGGTDQAVTVWNTTTKAALWTSSWNKGTSAYVYGVAIAPDGKTLAVCGSGTGNKIKVYDMNNGKVIAEMGKSNPGGNAIIYSSDSKSVYTGLTTYGDISKVTVVYKTAMP